MLALRCCHDPFELVELGTRPATPYDTDTAEWLSAWMDGELADADAVAPVTAWKSQASVQTAWSDFHRIGDALRSDDLAGHGSDLAFLSRLRERLRDEPLPVAPAVSTIEPPSPANVSRVRSLTRRWVVPMSMAAGVAMVSSAVWFSQGLGSSRESRTLALSAAPGSNASKSQALTLVFDTPASGVQTPEATQAVEFEPYLSAHKQYQPAYENGPSAGFLRNAVYESR